MEPAVELIEPVAYEDALAAIDRLGQSDALGIKNALIMLAKTDADDFLIQNALKLAKQRTSYPIDSIRKAYKAVKKNTGPNFLGDEQTQRPWQPYLVYRDAEGLKPAGVLWNVAMVIKHGEIYNREGQLIFGKNEFSQKVEVLAPLPWNADFPREITQHDLDNIQAHCQSHDIPTGNNAVVQAVSLAAADRTFNPVTDFLDECEKEWDRKPRLDLMLSTYCHVEDTALARACGARWMISAVARARDPGCQADCALIIEGSQGIKKSSFFRELGQDWFVDQISDLGNKDSLIETAGAWIIELAELDAMRRADVSKIKKYLAFRSDRYRPLWEKLTVDVPRHCIFAGTINPEGDGAQYLRDTTGGRRFWCFLSPGIDLEAVKRDVRQLWGEASYRFRLGEKWWLHETELQKEAAKAIEDRTDFGINEALEELILPWLGDRPSVTVAQVLRDAVHMIEGDIPRIRSAQMDVATILRKHGYSRDPGKRPVRWFKNPD